MNFFSKICSVCGLEKSINEFSLLTHDDETIHGDICAACRAAGNDKSSSGSQGHGLGLKIDAKAKIQHDSDFVIAEELKQAKDEFEVKHKQENLLHIIKRESENLKAAFISFVLSIVDKENAPAPQVTNEKNNPANKTKELQKEAGIQQGALVANQQKQDALIQDLHKAQVDLTTVYIDPNVTGQLKYFTAIFLQFKALMLAGAFIGTIERQMAKVHGTEIAMMENFADKTNTTKADHAPNLTVKPAVAEALVEKATPTMFSKPENSEQKPKKRKQPSPTPGLVH